MPLLIIKLLGFTKWLKDAAALLWKYIRLYPREAIILALLLACAWLWHGNTKRDRVIARWEQAAKAWETASKANRAAAEAQVKAWEAKSAQIAKENDNARKAAQASADNALASYIASHRVRSSGVCTASPATEGTNPGVGAEVPADPDMASISRADLQALVDWTVYGVAEHNRSVDKVRAGLAEVK